MNLHLGVVLVSTTAGRVTQFTREWADRAVQRFAEYVMAQSAGRQTITYKVFDWIALDKTPDEWSALGFDVLPAIRARLTESLEPFDHILVGIDHPTSSGGTTPGALTLLAATNFMPCLMAHELGHRFAADDAFGESPQGIVRYHNHFCVMGGENWPGTFSDSGLTDPSAPGLGQSGPGMSAPTLIAVGWLDENSHGLGVDLSPQSVFINRGIFQDLSALEGAPGGLWTRPPLVARYEDFLIEYRIRAPNGWDRGLPLSGNGAGGWIVAHRSPRNAPKAVHVNSIGALPGATLILGKDNPLDLFNPGPLKATVVSVDAEARTVRLHLSRRAAKQLPGGVSYGGVDVGGGGLVWTPGRGFTPVPPHSPLLRVLEHVATIQALQALLPASADNEVAGLSEVVSLELRGLREQVSALRVEPSLSPLEEAQASVSELQRLTERLALSPDDRELGQQWLETSRRELARVHDIVASKVEEERHI